MSSQFLKLEDLEEDIKSLLKDSAFIHFDKKAKKIAIYLVPYSLIDEIIKETAKEKETKDEKTERIIHKSIEEITKLESNGTDYIEKYQKKPINYFKECHISIFETSLLFPTGSQRIAFVVSIDNCSCLKTAPDYNCYTIGKSNKGGKSGANGIIISVILSDNHNCKYRVISEINLAIAKAFNMLFYFKGYDWECDECGP